MPHDINPNIVDPEKELPRQLKVGTNTQAITDMQVRMTVPRSQATDHAIETIIDRLGEISRIATADIDVTLTHTERKSWDSKPF